MSDILKCPYCGGILEQTSIYNLNSYACTDLTCKGYYINATKDMWQELIRTRKALEQSEICCTEWEKQALDYKAENIALSGNLERTRKVLEIAITGLKNCKTRDHIGAVCRIPEYVDKILEQIKTALEQKEHFADISKKIK